MATKLLSSLRRSCRLSLVRASQPLLATSRRNVSTPAPGPACSKDRERSSAGYYKNMHDSLLDLYNASGSTTDDRVISVTRFLSVSGALTGLSARS